MPPHLTFFVELASARLVELFGREEVVPFLRDGGHRLAMGILDLTPERAAVVRTLEAAGVPVTAWLLLDVRDGYWLNADNAPSARRRYQETMDWGEREGLRLHRVGLDIEFPRADAELLMRRPRGGLWILLRRRRARERVQEAERQYAALVAEIRAAGRTVESYHLPQLLDERRAGSMLLRRTLGLVDVAVDAEVFMLYSSYFGAVNCATYHAGAACIAVGVTGGGVHAGDPREIARQLGWAQLERDLLSAAASTDEVYVFSLEGCVEKGMLGPIAAIDWTKNGAAFSPDALRRARRRRALFQWVLRSERVIDLLV
jgi:hypothetical protein